jgi:hypothetical protein
MLAFYGLLQNPYWVPGGDSEAYTSSARDMALGMGFRFNGQPVAMFPPGWPAAMAAVMKVSPYFLPLKLMTMLSMAGALAIGYWIARRFVSPQRAAMVILATAIVSHMFQCTFWLMSEGLFCLVSAASLLVALQISQGRREAWRIALLALLCAGAVMVRWAGVVGLGLVAAILVSGSIRQMLAIPAWMALMALIGIGVTGGLGAAGWAAAGGAAIYVAYTAVAWKPWQHREFAAAAIVALVTFGTFFALREILEVTPEEAAASAEFGGAGEIVDQEIVATADEQATKGYDIVTGSKGGGGYRGRVLGWGRWFSFFYWQPFRAAAGNVALNLMANLLGWVLIALLLITAWAAARRRQWLWLALVGYCGILAANWPNPNSRYLVPIAFLLTLGIVLAADQLIAWAASERARRVVRGALYVFIGSVAVCNIALWAVEVRIARASDFYASYEAGLNQNLITAARHLYERGDVGDKQIAVSGKYRNMNRQRYSPYGLRAMSLLTGKAIVSVPNRYVTRDGRPTVTLNRWLYKRGIRYYLAQPPVSPWRVWHFRVPWWQEYRTGMPVEEMESGWQMYRVDGAEEARRVHLPPSRGWPRRVPGL